MAHALGERTTEEKRPLEVASRNAYSYLFTGLAMLLVPLLAADLLAMTGFLSWIGTLIKVVAYVAICAATTVGLGAVILSRAGTRRTFATSAGRAGAGARPDLRRGPVPRQPRQLMRTLIACLLLAASAISAAPATAQTWRTMTSARQLNGEKALDVEVTYAAGELDIRPAAGPLLYEMELRYNEEDVEPLARYDAAAGTLNLGVRGRKDKHRSDGWGTMIPARRSVWRSVCLCRSS